MLRIWCIADNILLLKLSRIRLSYLVLFNHWRLFNIHGGSWWAFRCWRLIANYFHLCALNCLRMLIFCCIWNYSWFIWNYLLRLCMLLIIVESILAVYIFHLFLIKIYAFRVWWLQSMLNLPLFCIILRFFIRIILFRGNKSLRFLIYWILTVFGRYVVRCDNSICIIGFLIFILVYLSIRYFVNRQHACIYGICWWAAYRWCLLSIVF